jgi:hypothetical protein
MVNLFSQCVHLGVFLALAVHLSLAADYYSTLNGSLPRAEGTAGTEETAVRAALAGYVTPFQGTPSTPSSVSIRVYPWFSICVNLRFYATIVIQPQS